MRQPKARRASLQAEGPAAIATMQGRLQASKGNGSREYVRMQGHGQGKRSWIGAPCSDGLVGSKTPVGGGGAEWAKEPTLLLGRTRWSCCSHESVARFKLRSAAERDERLRCAIARCRQRSAPVRENVATQRSNA